MNTTEEHEPRIEVTAPLRDRYDEILSPAALGFLAELHDRFASRRHELLAERMRRRVDIANGRDPQFIPETAWIRADPDWRVAGAGPGLEDRRVEITGPTDRKMAINALNSGARVWLADQEDATSPTWQNVIGGQLTLHDAVRAGWWPVALAGFAVSTVAAVALSDAEARLEHLPEHHADPMIGYTP